jgi:hypothetical protein
METLCDALNKTCYASHAGHPCKWQNHDVLCRAGLAIVGIPGGVKQQCREEPPAVIHAVSAVYGLLEDVDGHFLSS